METNNKLREALSDATELLESILAAFSKGTGGVYMSDVAEAIDNARAALAEPVKNCEVGTPEEQEERLHAYCKSHRCLYCSSGNGDECKFYRPGMKTDCKIEWANAPYEEGGDK